MDRHHQVTHLVALARARVLRLEDRVRLARPAHSQQMLEHVPSPEELLEGLLGVGGETVLAHEGSVLQDSLLQSLLAVLVVNLPFFGCVRADVPSWRTSKASAAWEKRW